MEREKAEVIVEGVAIVILVALCVAVVIHGNTLSCDKCLVTFESKVAPVQVQVQELYNYLQEDKCYVYKTASGFGILFEAK